MTIFSVDDLDSKKSRSFHHIRELSFSVVTLLSLPDESAEETFTVFDHPVMRVYKSVK